MTLPDSVFAVLPDTVSDTTYTGPGEIATALMLHPALVGVALAALSFVAVVALWRALKRDP